MTARGATGPTDNVNVTERLHRLRVREADRLSDLWRASVALQRVVYCWDRRYESPSDHPDRDRFDRYDNQSVRAVVQSDTGEIIATVRIILSDEDRPVLPGLSASEELRDWVATLDTLGKPIAEISAFCCTRNAMNASGQTAPLLIGAVCAMMRARGLEHGVMLVEKYLQRLLLRYGIPLISRGEPVEHHGTRVPCGLGVSEALAGMRGCTRPGIADIARAAEDPNGFFEVRFPILRKIPRREAVSNLGRVA